MKLNRLETHDRLVHFKKDQNDSLQQGADDCLKKNPLSLAMQDKAPYVYLFAHPRTHDDGVTKRMIWQPRLTKPLPQTNSYLFRAISKSDIIEICWLIPDEKLWKQYEKGKVTENEIVLWSIDQYINRRDDLARKDKDDLPDERVAKIYQEIARESDKPKFENL